MFDFVLTPAQRELRDAVRSFAQAEISPVAERSDRERALPPEIGAAFHRAGFAARFLDPEAELAFATEASMVTEELGYACAAFASYLMLPVFFNRVVLSYLPPAEARELRDALAREHIVTAFAASERAAGSDLPALATSAERTADGYRLSGRKEYSSNLRQAHQVIVVARTATADGAGLTWFLVPVPSAGLSVGERWETLGLRAMDLSPLELRDVEIPASLRLGDEGRGLAMMNEHLARSRTGIAALAVGIARRARDLVLEFGGRRRVYGDKLTRLQDYRFRIAEMEKEIAAARGLVWLSAQRADAGLDHGKEASLAKLYAGQMVMRVTEEALLMLGSIGYTGQTVADKLFRDARHVAIVEGPEPVHKEIVFAHVLRRGGY